MADMDTSFYSSACQDDTLSRYLLKRKPSTDSLRERLESLADASNPKRGKQKSSKTPDKHRSPRLVRVSRRILQSKPKQLKEEEDELKRLTGERMYWYRQQENARRAEAGRLALTASPDLNNPIPNLLPTSCFRPKQIGLQQLNAIKDQIQVIKQELTHRYPELPSPKPDEWFREGEELEPLSDIINSTGGHRTASNIPHQSRVFVEKGVGSIQRKIKSIKLKRSHPSTIPEEHEKNTTSVPVEQASFKETISNAPSLTNFTGSIGTPDTELSHTRLSSQGVSPLSTNRVPHSSQFQGKENDEINGHDNHATFTPVYGDYSPTTSITPRPTQLSIVTQGLPDPGPSQQSKQAPSNVVPFRFDPVVALPLSPTHWPDNSSELPQWQNSAMEYLAEDRTGQIDRWVFSSSLMAQSGDSPLLSRPSRRLSLDVPPRGSSEASRRKSETDSALPHPSFPISGFPVVDRDISDPQFGPHAIPDPQFFVEKQTPSQVILATDVLIEHQGGLSFLGQENFNERFRSKPWQTMKTLKQYDRPGHSDAEYLPGVSRVALVQTPHSPTTFPLPTPEWYWLTKFSIDRQSKPVDDNGWEYYDIFSRKWSAHRHGCRTFIRRRRWVRVRGKLDLVNPPPVDLQSARVFTFGDNPCVEMSDIQPAQPIVVLIKKQGFHQSITFNSMTVEGGHSLTCDLPGFPSLHLRWDDSSLGSQNPLFSSHAVATEIFQFLVSQGGNATNLEHEQDIMECLKDQIATINLNRVAKTVAGLSEPQKLDLWRYWLDSDPSADSSTANKPEADDIWRVVERHINDVLDTFVFDFHRVRFLSLLVDIYTRNFGPPVLQRKTTKNDNLAHQEDQASVPEAIQRPTKRVPSRPSLNTLTFLKKSEGNPSFLDIKNIQLEYWNNLITLFVEAKQDRRPGFVADQSIRLKLTHAQEIRKDLSKFLKSQNKLRRAATTTLKRPISSSLAPPTQSVS
ncbi:hypothetical protein Pst134EA_001011 [Puccinia striiformis f. sp. tritici]|uniref:hypothetical protein n=1 Tax=Puccinia striiformis f. sp. tritici TaxID=168172 RepID=UPI00200839D9|nr:hypothetical protein Pst134EA_001011 [Puccinia striiformis f. sp. tritici]KAH9473955.1 hypothetical protein Pst134EA_001011 [Puccinia striiformis f. sp. tritici]